MILQPIGSGVTDHGTLNGLTDDDHVAYLRIGTARGLLGERLYIANGAEGSAYFEWAGGRLTLNVKGTVEQTW